MGKAVEPASGSAPPRGLAQEIRSWLSHPLVLLMIGAAISSLLIPFLTRGWQNYEKELDIRTALAGEMTKSVTDLVMAVQFVEVLAPFARETRNEEAEVARQFREEFERMNEAYRQWQIDSAVIGARLRSYFPGTELGADWVSYRRVAERFYALGQTAGQDGERAEQIDALIGALRRIAACAAISDAARAEVRTLFGRGTQVEGGTWLLLRAHVTACNDALVARVLDADVEAL